MSAVCSQKVCVHTALDAANSRHCYYSPLLLLQPPASEGEVATDEQCSHSVDSRTTHHWPRRDQTVVKPTAQNGSDCHCPCEGARSNECQTPLTSISQLQIEDSINHPWIRQKFSRMVKANKHNQSNTLIENRKQHTARIQSIDARCVHMKH